MGAGYKRNTIYQIALFLSVYILFILTGCSNGGDSTTVINNPDLQSISISPNDPSILTGTSVSLSVVGSFTEGYSKPVTQNVQWSSENLSIVEISTDGVLTGVSAGQTTISAQHSNFTATTTVIVTAEPELTNLQVTPSNVTLTVGGNQQIVVNGQFNDGQSKPIATGLNWSSSDETIAIVDENGMITAIADGQATIEILHDGHVASVILTVVSAAQQQDFISMSSKEEGVVTTRYFDNRDEQGTGPYGATHLQSSVAVQYDAIGTLKGTSWRDTANGTVISFAHEYFYGIGSEYIFFALYFAGDSVGEYTYSNGQTQAYLAGSYGTGLGYMISKDYPDAEVTVNVARYDAVGGRIQGTYAVKLCEESVVMSGGECSAIMNSTVTYSGSFDVTRLPDNVYENQGSVQEPYVIDYQYAALNNPTFKVGQGESYYALEGSLTSGGSTDYTLGIGKLTDIAELFVYSDSDFTQLICSNTTTNSYPKDCSFSSGADPLYIKVVYGGSNMGATYTFFLIRGDTLYRGEGTEDAPIHFNVLPVTHDGAVNSYANSFYTADVIPGGDYLIRKIDTLSAGAELYVYEGGFNGELLCKTGYSSSFDICSVQPQTSQIYILVRGAYSGTGTPYKLNIATGNEYVNEGVISAPLDVGDLSANYIGEIAARGTSYYSATVTPGVLYSLNLSDVFTDGELMVYDVNGQLCAAVFTTFPVNRSCEFTATEPSVSFSIRNYEPYGTNFSVDIVEISYQSEGTPDQPIVYELPCLVDCYYPPTINEPIDGEVDLTASYYAISLPPDDKGYTYLAALQAKDSDVGFSVYSDPFFNNLLCEQVNLGEMPKSCLLTSASNMVYIKVDGSQTQNGSRYQFTINGPVLFPEGDVTNPVNLGSAPVSYTGGVLAVSTGISSYYVVAVQQGRSYEITLNNIYYDANLTIYEDAAFTSSLCPPFKEYYGIGFDERCIVKPNTDLIYIKIESGYYNEGAKFDLRIDEFVGDIYYIELLPNAIGNHARPVMSIYEENSTGAFLTVSPATSSPFPSISQPFESGKTYYIRIGDNNSEGGAYSINISNSGFSVGPASGIPDVPDVYEPLDNYRNGATPLVVNQIQHHSFSFNDGDFGDTDWFVFTVP